MTAFTHVWERGKAVVVTPAAALLLKAAATSGHGPTSWQKMNEQSDHYDPDERGRYRDDHNLTHRFVP